MFGLCLCVAVFTWTETALVRYVY